MLKGKLIALSVVVFLALPFVFTSTPGIANGVGVISKVEAIVFVASATSPTLYIVGQDDEITNLSNKARQNGNSLAVRVSGTPLRMHLRPTENGEWLHGYLDAAPLRIRVVVMTKSRAARVL